MGWKPAEAEVVAAGFVLLGNIVLMIAWAIGMFIFREFGIPIMFQRGTLAWAAFVESTDLAVTHLGSVVVFILLRFAIGIGVAVISIVICCGTCCLYMLPYIGTVMLLPVVIYVRCFTLECLAQFGPQYNVWTAEMGCPPELVAPVSLPPRHG
jgi:hypothetical protein